MRSRLRFLLSLLILGVAVPDRPACGADSDASSTKRAPNVLFLYTDQQRYDTLQVYGNDVIEMPHLNRLARQSTVFMRAYDTQPVCTPARSSLLTGLYPHQNGCINNNIPLRPETKCLPEMLSRGKWMCAHMGKWHLGDEIYPQHGFTVWKGTEDTYHRWYSEEREEYADRSAYHHWLIARGVEPQKHDNTEGQPWLINRFFRKQIHSLPEEHCRPKFLAEAASAFIREQGDEPWVLFVNTLEPHHPYNSCRDDQYDPADVTLPPNFQAQLSSGHRLSARLDAAERRRKMGEQDWRELIARYWGMNSLVDTCVGEILAALRASGADDNTIVVFTTDHGDMMGDFSLLGKSQMYEASSRVPLLVRLPSQREQRKIDCPVSQVDLVPTLLDLMGQPLPKDLPGASLRALLEGSKQTTGRDVFIQWNQAPEKRTPIVEPLPDWAKEMGTAEEAAASKVQEIRTIVSRDNWKLNYSTVGEHELFDLNDDPHERVNLFGAPEYAAKARELAQRIRNWQRWTNDELRLPRL